MFLEEYFPGRIIEHPPYSPDLNPMENLGSQFKRLFYKYLRNWPADSDFLLETLTRVAWREVGDNEVLVASPIDSLPSRYQAVVDARGSHTRY